MSANSTRRPPAIPRFLFGLFFLSGVSGLMYEVVWVRMLTRVLGSTTYAMSTVLAVFMGGLALGSFLAGRFADRFKRPFLWYAGLEVAIAGSALLSLFLPDALRPLYRVIYDMAGGNRSLLTAGQISIAALVLLLPTMLMGATLPTLCAVCGRFQQGFQQKVATLYAVNTLGALVGVLAAGFVLIGLTGETATLATGAALNVLIAAYALRHAAEIQTDAHRDEAVTPIIEPQAKQSAFAGTGQRSDGLRRLVLMAFAANGFIALATEVIWGRMLVMYQGTSIYAFSSMLAVVLGGIGLGSYWMGRILDQVENPLRTYGRVQLLAAAASLIALHQFGWLGGMARPSFLHGANLKVMFVAPILLLGPVSLLWGAGFPLATRCYNEFSGRVGRDVSNLYAWNTMGSILGSLAGGFWLISTFGVAASAVGLGVVGCAIGAAMLSFDSRRRAAATAKWEWATVVLCGVLAASAGDPYYKVIAQRMQQRVAGHTEELAELYFHEEGASGTTTAFGPYKQLWVNGEGMTHLCVETKLMAHLPLALADDPQKTLVVCCGMGTSLRSVAAHNGVEAWVVELLPDVFDCVKYFHADMPDVLARDDIHAVADDGRNYLQMNERRYDVITVDPAPPFYASGTVNLYTAQFFELAKSRLTDGGVFCLWIPPWKQNEIAYVMRNFVSEFEHVSVWTGPELKGFYMLGKQRPFERIEQRIHRLFEDPAIVKDLTQWDELCGTPEKVLALQATDRRELAAVLRNGPAMTDDRPYTEFPLWRSVRFEENPAIFTGDVLREDLAALRKQMQTVAGK